MNITYVASFHDADGDWIDGNEEVTSKAACIADARDGLMKGTYAFAVISRHTPFLKIEKTLKEGPSN